MDGTKQSHTHPVPLADDADGARRRPVLGIDPGLQRTGYAFLTPGCAATGNGEAQVLEAGVIRLDAKQPLEYRLAELRFNLSDLIDRFAPAVLACEQLYAHYRHPRTAILMAHARGVVLGLAATVGIPVVNIAATHAKKLLTGSGRASKQQMQHAVAATLKLQALPEPNDVADAIAIALSGLRLRTDRTRLEGDGHAAPLVPPRNRGRAAPVTGASR